MIPDVAWLTRSGSPMQPQDWSDPALRTVVASLYAPQTEEKDADRVLIVLHADGAPAALTLPETREGRCWRRRIDTSQEDGGGDEAFEEGAVISLAPRSVVVFDEKPADKPTFAVKTVKSVAPDLLDKLSLAAGIAPDWYDISGVRHVVPPETKAALLADMRLPAASSGEARDSLAHLSGEIDRRALPFSLVAREGETITLRIPLAGGRAPSALLIRRDDETEMPIRLGPADLELTAFTALDGRRIEAALVKLPPQPVGRHRIIWEQQPDTACRLTVAPARCYLPDALLSGKKAAGIAAQLYSLRRAGDQGIGDFTALGGLAAIAGRAGFATVGVNPLHALFPSDRERASPYYPSDRRFLDPIYIDVAELASMCGGGRTAAALARHGGSLAALASKSQVDYTRVWAAKRAVLDAAFADFESLKARSPSNSLFRDFDAFVAAGGEALFQFACFQAISETRQGEQWAKWPAGLSRRDPGALDAFARDNARLTQFHLYLQWLCERQLSGAAAEGRDNGLWLGFYRDLAVGAAPDGAEAWANADQLMKTSAVGAPPDPFSETGQNWGLQPPNPLDWRRSGYDFFNQMIAANMRHAGAMRIDHAMALARLFVIPSGAKALEGAYLSYPVGDLLGQLALESARASCLLVGEDLGTVPMGFRETMQDANVLSYRVFWFERSWDGYASPSSYPQKSLACLSTHDLPTLGGWWEGEDIREREALGLLAPEEAAAAREGRAADKRALLRLVEREGLQVASDLSSPIDASAVAAVHRVLGRASSLITIAQIEDLTGELTAVNFPGTDLERPNWRRKLNTALEDLPETLATFAGILKG